MAEITESWLDGSERAPAPESVSCSISRCPTSSATRSRRRNVFYLLAQREVSTRTKNQAKKHWTKSLRCDAGSAELRFWSTDARHDLFSWAESQSLHHWSAIYCALEPTPRSTIAAAFSPDGKTVASTHGDHTVKIIDFQTGKCLKELLGHERTPWVVRYHPLYPNIVASGSLDHEVRLWDAEISHCIGAHRFYKPIGSIAFHAKGELLAVASGHKLFIWDYSKRGGALNPAMILRTRRSLRAVHFHPHGSPYLLTAEVEVSNLDFGDSTLTLATSSGYSNCRSAVIVSNSKGCRHLEYWLSSPCLFWPAYLRADEIICPLCNSRDIDSTHLQQTLSSLTQNAPSDSDVENEENSQLVTPMDVCPVEPGVAAETESHTVRLQSDTRAQSGSAATNEIYSERDGYLRRNIPNQVIIMRSRPDGPSDMPVDPFTDLEHVGASSSVPDTIGSSSGLSQNDTSLPRMTASVPGVESLLLGTQIDESGVRTVSLGIGSEVPTSLFDSGAELPCTVKLKIWRHNIKYPCAAFDAGACCLTISHAVLCSEMGTHFSPCGRFLVACVACMLPQTEGDHGNQLPMQHDSTGAGTSPTRHTLPSNQVIYELRVYSLEEATFGTVLASRAIRAAHCLTSIQFSPTSEHILLAYGRRHSSLLRSIFFDGRKTIVPVYTVLEVYRVSDMELVRVLPSALDEVNVACFHPSSGAGLVYGTKEGKLRILQHKGANMGPDFFAEQNMLEVQRQICYCDNILENFCASCLWCLSFPRINLDNVLEKFCTCSSMLRNFSQQTYLYPGGPRRKHLTPASNYLAGGTRFRSLLRKKVKNLLRQAASVTNS